jgi:signal transduction histidine kinase
MPQWLDRLAHDLRGPLGPLQTASYLLRSGALDAGRQNELFDLIDRQTRRLSRMIDEIGDWSRATQGRLVSSRQECEPDALLALAIEGDVALSNVAPAVSDAAVHARLWGDPNRLVQLMRVVAAFAASRCTAPPRVEMTRDGERLRLDVECDGAAVDAAALLDAPLPDPPDEGLGLQLLIARAIAEAHGGRLMAEAVGDGLRLRCELPVA